MRPFSWPALPSHSFRGYLAVTAQVEGHTIRFANTHLEVQRFQDTQVAQARQLIEELAASTVPVVLVGDFNSAANHDAARDEGTPTYKMLRNAGYADLWIREAGSVTGYTCCQGADLTNEVSLLDQRLDLVLVRYGNAGFGGRSMVKLIGDEPSDRITVEHPWLGWVTLWPSDHAGVAATMWPAPGLRKKW
jgi:endonuclease/exonuclease/phosphatase family metal-dependent hydrolase